MNNSPDTDTERDRLIHLFEAVRFEPPGAEFTFHERLCRDNGWSPEFGERAIAEYRRFVTLAMLADHSVTPSDVVDQVWHLHLTYTESYWTEMCGQALGRRLHHGPTRGGPAERVRYRDGYRATLDTYANVFGEAPPADIWPTVEERFAGGDRFQRVNLTTHRLVTRGLALRLAPFAAIGIVASAIVLHINGNNVGRLAVEVVALVALAGGIGTLAWAAFGTARHIQRQSNLSTRRRSEASGCSGGCSGDSCESGGCGGSDGCSGCGGD